MVKQNLLQARKPLFTPFCERGFKPIYFDDANVIITKYEDKIHILDPLTWESIKVDACPPDFNPRFIFPVLHDGSIVVMCLDVEGNLLNTSDMSIKRTLSAGSLITSFTTTSNTIFLGLSNHTIAVYDLISQKIVKNISCGHGSRISFLFSHSDILLAFSDDGVLSCWRNFQLHKIFRTSVSCISSFVNIGQSMFLATSLDNTLLTIDLHSNSLKVLSFQTPIAGILSFSDGSYNLLDVKGQIFDYEPSGKVSVIQTIGMDVLQLVNINDSSIFISDCFGTFHRYSYSQTQRMIIQDGYVVPTDYSDLPDSFLSCDNNVYMPCNKLITCHSLKDNISRLAQCFVGHHHEVLCLTNYGQDILVSCSKSGELCFWSFSGHSLLLRMSNVGIDNISSIHSFESCGSFGLAVGSETGFLKYFKMSGSSELCVSEQWVTQCHQKDINTIYFSKNKGHIVTGSQDKSICVVNLGGKIISHIKHHKRGVWSIDCCKGLLASASADKTIFILNEDLQVLHTIHGHDSAVTKVKFIDSSILLSGDANGIIKLWKISKKVDEIGSVDILTGSIWSVFSHQENIISVDSSGTFYLLERSTGSFAGTVKNYNLNDEKLQVLIQKGDYIKALAVAIELDKPDTSFKMIDKLILAGPNDDILSSLSESSSERLLSWTKNWLAHPRKNVVGQWILSSLLIRDNSILSKNDLSLLSSYTSRTLNRIDDIISSSYSYKVIIDNK